jgi:hypothetical protein
MLRLGRPAAADDSACVAGRMNRVIFHGRAGQIVAMQQIVAMLAHTAMLL